LKAYRWIFLNPAPLPRLPLLDRFSFQPTDLAKLAVVIFLASWLSEGKDKVRFRKSLPSKASFLVYLKFLSLLFFVVLLTVAEPDFGTATILALTMLGTYFFASAPLPFLLLSFFLSLGGAALSILTSPYRRERLTSFLRRTEADPLTVGYHLQQALIALGSGGWAGLGLGQSRQKYEYLPEAATDSIFAVVGEELGFLGTTAVLLLFLFVVWRGLRISRRAPDELGRLLAGGIVTWLTAQALINIAAMINLLPLTGVTLPLLSYGGSSLVVTLTAIGILLNISRQTVEVRRK
jgi:cell division protein FtsW